MPSEIVAQLSEIVTIESIVGPNIGEFLEQYPGLEDFWDCCAEDLTFSGVYFREDASL